MGDSGKFELVKMLLARMRNFGVQKPKIAEVGVGPGGLLQLFMNSGMIEREELEYFGFDEFAPDTTGYATLTSLLDRNSTDAYSGNPELVLNPRQLAGAKFSVAPFVAH